MKHLLAALLIVQLTFALDYSTLTGPFISSSCQEKTTTQAQSPVIIEGPLCGPFSSFAINLPTTTLATAGINSARQLITGGPTFDYTTGTLQVNGTSWSTQEIVFRYKAEHQLFNHKETEDSAIADYEMQIRLVGGKNKNLNGQLSFLIRKATNPAQKQAMTKLPILTKTGTETINVAFNTLTSSIDTKLKNDIYLNMFTYNGTFTYPSGNIATATCTKATWFIYGSELYVSEETGLIIETWVKNMQTNNIHTLKDGVYNARLNTGTGGGSGEFHAERLCYTGYFRVTMGDNYGLWFGVSIIFFFFVLTLMFGEKPITNPDYRESVWTHHPFVSLYKYGNEIHTRKTRAALFMATLTIHGMFTAVWYENCDADKRTRSSNTIVYGVYSMILSVLVIQMIGYILRSYYLAKYQYAKTKDERWDQRAQNRIFGYYFSIFSITIVGWSICVWKMNGLHAEDDQDPSRMWVASFFIGLGLEWLIVDPIVCLLSRSVGAVRDFAKSKGYMYDNVMHETYMLFLKMD